MRWGREERPLHHFFFCVCLPACAFVFSLLLSRPSLSFLPLLLSPSQGGRSLCPAVYSLLHPIVECSAEKRHPHPITRATSLDFMNDFALNDFNHIVEASHIAFANAGAGGQSTSTMNTFMSEHPFIGVESVTHGLLPANMGCPRCAQISAIRENLKGVEALYLQEITHLKSMVAQIDRERVDAINRAEQVLLTLERTKKQILSKDREIQSLEGNLRQIQDQLYRSEYELDSLRHLYRRDVAFYHDRELLLFWEKEESVRASIASTEAGWRSALEVRCIGILKMARGEKCPRLGDSCALLVSPRGSDRQRSTRDLVSPSPVHHRPPSITRRVATDRIGGAAAAAGGGEEVAPPFLSSVCSIREKGGLVTDLWLSKRSVDDTNARLQCETQSKDDQIASLRLLVQKLQQSAALEEKCHFPQLLQDHVAEEGLVVEMQDEIDDLLRSELLLLQRCERHRLEEEAMEERLQALQWLLRQHTFSSSTWLLNRRDVTPEKQKGSAFRLTPKMSPRIDDAHLVGEKREELRDLVSQAVRDALSGAFSEQLFPIKLSVESIRARSDELHSDMRRYMRELVHDGDVISPKVILEDLKKDHAAFLDDARQVVLDIAAGAKSHTVDATAAIRDAFAGMGRLMTQNADIMDGKLSDMLTCQSAMSRHLAAVASSLSPPAAGGGIVVDTSVSPAPHVKHVSFKRPLGESPSRDDDDDDGGGGGVTLPSHEWDMVESDDESIPPLPHVSTARRTPYDVDI